MENEIKLLEQLIAVYENGLKEYENTFEYLLQEIDSYKKLIKDTCKREDVSASCRSMLNITSKNIQRKSYDDYLKTGIQTDNRVIIKRIIDNGDTDKEIEKLKRRLEDLITETYFACPNCGVECFDNSLCYTAPEIAIQCQHCEALSYASAWYRQRKRVETHPPF